jgi:hypothetical protein
MEVDGAGRINLGRESGKDMTLLDTWDRRGVRFVSGFDATNCGERDRRQDETGHYEEECL